jgi:enoyl-CoA hydratase/carnithine racemase
MGIRRRLDAMTDYRHILYAVSDGVAWITLNRPEKRNPLDALTIGELIAGLGAARDDAAVRAIVLTGAGKAFSAGGDLGRPSMPLPDAGIGPGRFADLMRLFPTLHKPTIAMVNGHAMGGGLGVVTACDLAIAADDALLGTPEIDVGLFPMMIMAPIFRSVGRKRALEMVLTGEKVDAATAARIGLVNRAVPRDRLEAEVKELAAKLAGKSPKILALGLAAYYDTCDLAYDEAIGILEGRLAEVFTTEDAMEGLAAFLEKRPPVWKGK